MTIHFSGIADKVNGDKEILGLFVISVYCKIEMQEVAIEKCRLLHIENAGNCKNCGE